MKKDEFIDKLTNSLEKLEDEDRKKVIRKYKATFTRKKKKGKSEEEIVEEFGNFNDLVNGILQEHGIQTTVQESAHTIVDFFKEFIKVVEDIVDYLSSHKATQNTTFILKILISLIFVSILKLPILLIRDFGKGILNLLVEPISSILIFCWGFILEIIYVIVAISIFVLIFNRLIKPKKKRKK